jgi:hypothetical protein
MIESILAVVGGVTVATSAYSVGCLWLHRDTVAAHINSEVYGGEIVIMGSEVFREMAVMEAALGWVRVATLHFPSLRAGYDEEDLEGFSDMYRDLGEEL